MFSCGLKKSNILLGPGDGGNGMDAANRRVGTRSNSLSAVRARGLLGEGGSGMRCGSELVFVGVTGRYWVGDR